MDFIQGLIAMLVIVFCRFLYNENKKHNANVALYHTDEDGRSWKFLTEGKSCCKIFLYTDPLRRKCYVDKKFWYISVVIKKIYYNDDLNDLIPSKYNKNKSLIKYDILTLHFILDPITPAVCFGGCVSYDFDDNPVYEVKGVESPFEFNDFITTIEKQSEVEMIYEAINKG